jgi:undecaprenyl-diphosphatase
LATLLTAFVGLPIFVLGLKSFSAMATGFVAGIIGAFLIITGLVQLKKPESVFKTKNDLKMVDALVAGCLQGLSVLPGFSRSGLTVAGLLFRKFKETEALRLSFLMSLPAVLGGNIILNLAGFNNIEFNFTSFAALAASFITGILTIGLLLKISRKINFGWFAIGFGVLTLISLFFVGS